jgi:hypothetical protein
MPAGKGQAERIALRRREALRLRAMGQKYAEIGEALGVSEATAWRDCTGELKRTRDETGEAAEEVRVLELERLDIATKGVMPKVLEGDERATDVMLRIQARRAKLLGLDSPDRQQVEVTGIDPRELLAARLGRDSG